ncbi:MAG: Peptidase family M50 [Microgenomates bacterium OLB22]|nr:MAG: Peptidase family M50 [Microgenomates bacterium OLB22]
MFGLVLVSRLLLGLFDLPTSIHGTVMNVPVEITLTSLLMMLVFWLDSMIYIRKHHLGVANYLYAGTCIIVVIVVVGSIVLHEFGHGLVATLLGQDIDHAALTYWGAYVAHDQSFLTMTPFVQGAIALAGPATNVIIAFIAVMIVKIFGESLFENSAQYVAVMNIRLARLNMIPIFVLDGGKALDALLRLVIDDRTTRTYAGIAILVAVVHLYQEWRKEHRPYEESLSRM